MTNSHLLGFLIFGVFAVFALLAWVVSYKQTTPVENAPTPGTTRALAVGLLVLGAILGGVAFSTDSKMRKVTLHEEMVEGSVGVRPGASTPVREVRFMVEHPGVAHELFLSPTAKLLDPPRGPVDMSLSLHGPGGEALIPERTERFSVRPGSDSERPDWNGKTFSFTPTVAGAYRVRVKPLMTGIPKIQVRIVDPLKRDGERPSGY